MADLQFVKPPENTEKPEECPFCFGSGRHRGRYGHNDPDCSECGGSGWRDGQHRDPITGRIFQPIFGRIGRVGRFVE